MWGGVLEPPLEEGLGGAREFEWEGQGASRGPGATSTVMAAKKEPVDDPKADPEDDPVNDEVAADEELEEVDEDELDGDDKDLDKEYPEVDDDLIDLDDEWDDQEEEERHDNPHKFYE